MRAYQQARIEANRVFEMTKALPKEETFSPTDQIRRSSRAVKSMIAEAWGHRRYPAAFVSKLTDAISEANEPQSWLDDALDCGYVNALQHLDFNAAWQSIGGMIASMVVKADDFCKT